MVGVTLLAFGLRVHLLTGQSLWSDEGISILRARQALWPLLRTMPVEHTPLYFVLLHLWMKLTGEGDFAVRFLSVAPSVLAVPVLYALGKRLGDEKIGLLAAILLAINPFQVWYAQEARMYALLVALSALSSLYLVRLWRLEGNPLFNLVGYAFSTAAALYTHYYAALVVGAHVAFAGKEWLSGKRKPSSGHNRNRRFNLWLTGLLGSGALFAPWLPRAVQLFSFSGWREPIDPWSVPWTTFRAYTLGTVLPIHVEKQLASGFVVLLALGIWALVRRGNWQAHFVLIFTFLPFFVVWVYTFIKPDFHERYLISSTAGLVLVFAFALRWPWSSHLTWWRVIFGFGLFTFVIGAQAFALYHHYYAPRTRKPDFKGAAAYIARFERPGDGILVDGPDPQKVFLHYYRGSAPVYDLRDLDVNDEKAVAARLAPLAERHTRLWTLLYFHPPAGVQEWLSRHAYLVEMRFFGDILLYLHTTASGEASGPFEARQIEFGEGFNLIAAQIEPLPARVGEAVRVTLRWHVSGPLQGNEKIALRLLDPWGREVAGQDRFVQESFHNCGCPDASDESRHGLLVPFGTPPGEYSLLVRLYRAGGPMLGENIVGAVRVETGLLPVERRWLDAEHEINAPLGEDLTVLGRTGPPTILKPGQPAPVALFLQADRAPKVDYLIRLVLVDAQGNVWGQATPEALTTWPTSRWRSGEVARLLVSLTPDPATPSGRYRLVIRSEAPSQAEVVLGNVEVVGRPRRYTVPSISRPQRAFLGEGVEFLGYDLKPKRVSPGATVELTLYWRARARMETAYTVFTHLLDPSEMVRGQLDQPPLGGEAPTTTWLPGEVLVDRYVIPIAPDAPPGTYRVEIGMYNPATLERLPAFDETGRRLQYDRILLEDTVEVVP